MQDELDMEQLRRAPHPIRRWATPSGRSARVTAIGAMTLGLLLGGAGVASATSTSTSPPAGGSQPHGGPGGAAGGRPTASGKVTAVGTDSFTITTSSGATVTVDVSSATTYKDKGSSTTFAAVKVGEQVGVTGTESSGTVTATSVMVGLPAGGGRPPGGPGSSSGGTPPAA